MKRFQTDRRLWLIASAGVFVTLSFVEVAVKHDSYNLWDFVGMLFRGKDTLLGVIGWSVIWAVPAIVFGWVLQAVIVAARGKSLPVRN